MTDTQDMQERPRWARDLADKMWRRINELLEKGWRTMDIVRELEIPEAKVRSLHVYVRKFGPQRRLNQFARFKDALLRGVEDLGVEMIDGLKVTAALAVSNNTKSSVQIRAIEAMTNFTNVMQRMMQQDAKDAQGVDLRVEVKRTDGKLSKAAIDEIRDIYGLDADGNDDATS